MSDENPTPDGDAEEAEEEHTPLKDKFKSVIERLFPGKKELIAEITSDPKTGLSRDLVYDPDSAAPTAADADQAPKMEQPPEPVVDLPEDISASEELAKAQLPATQPEPEQAIGEVHAVQIASATLPVEAIPPEAERPTDSFVPPVIIRPAIPTAPHIPKKGRSTPARHAHRPPVAWQVVGASVIGPHHSEHGEAGEDAWAFAESQTGIAVAIVSDGAGSATHAAFASQFVANGAAAIADALAGLWSDAATPAPAMLRPARRAVRAALSRLRDDLIATAKSKAHDPDDYLSTVVGVVAHRRAGALLFHIGDGAASAFDTEGRTIATSQPENGEYDNETYFLVDDIWQQHFRCTYVRPVPKPGDKRGPLRDIMLMSDGAADIAYNRKGRRREPVEAFVLPVTAALARETPERAAQMLAATLLSETASERSDDDKTLLWLRPADGGP